MELDPDEWDDADKESLAREIRKRTKPIIIAANKMDKPVSQENYEEITARYEHLTFVPVSAHAEKALKNGDERGSSITAPATTTSHVTATCQNRRRGLEQIREFVTEFGGTGVQQSLETALFEELGAIAIFPGARKPQDDGTFRGLLYPPEGRRRGLRVPSAFGHRRRPPPRHDVAPSARSVLTLNLSIGTWSRSRRRTERIAVGTAFRPAIAGSSGGLAGHVQ